MIPTLRPKCVLFALLVLAIPAAATPIAIGEYYDIRYQGTTPPVAMVAGGGYVADSGETLLNPGNAPWEFTAPASGALLLVSDLFAPGDVFEVFNFGASLGTTSAVPAFGAVNCGSDIPACLADNAISKGVFALAAGDYSITINVIQLALTGIGGAPFGDGAGFMRLTVPDEGEVPEPSTFAAAGLGLIALALWRRRR